MTSVEAGRGVYVVESQIGRLAASSADVLRCGDKVVLSLRPEDVELASVAFDGPNAFDGIVDAKVFLGEHVEFRVKVGDVVGEAFKQSWIDYLNGLWWSGLRLAESLELYWDRQDRLCVDLTGKRPMLRIPAALEKGNRDRLLPMAPEFAEWLAEVPFPARHGRVFRPEGGSVTRCEEGGGVQVRDGLGWQ